jgi:hypothetical protein
MTSHSFSRVRFPQFGCRKRSTGKCCYLHNGSKYMQNTLNREPPLRVPFVLTLGRRQSCSTPTEPPPVIGPTIETSLCVDPSSVCLEPPSFIASQPIAASATTRHKLSTRFRQFASRLRTCDVLSIGIVARVFSSFVNAPFLIHISGDRSFR